MTRLLKTTSVALMTSLLVVGCGSNGSKSVRGVTTPPTTTPPTTTTLTDVHGEMVWVGTSMAFLPDGATEALELSAPVPGAYARGTLTLSGDVSTPNAAGQTTLSESIAVTAAQLDDVMVTGRLQQSAFLLLSTNDGEDYEPTGSLAASLLQEPLDTPVRVTGTYDPNHISASGAPGLVITSWRSTAEISFRTVGGLLGVRDVYTVDDLTGGGSQRQSLTYVTNFGQPRLGQGFLSESDRALLATAVATANLRSQPTTFNRTIMVLDIPTQYIDYADRNGSLRITILRPTVLPQELDDLITLMASLRQGLASARDLESGSQSGITQAGTRVVRNQADLTALYAQHSPGATVPTVDFTANFVVALFMGQQSTGGYSIGVKRMLRTGNEIRIDVRRTVPTGIVTQVITAPFQINAIEHQGATGDVYVDGVKQ